MTEIEKKVKNITHKGDLPLETIKKVAKTMETEGKSLSKSFKGTVKQVLGTAQSLGCTVNKKHPKKVIEEIDKGEIKIE